MGSTLGPAEVGRVGTIEVGTTMGTTEEGPTDAITVRQGDKLSESKLTVFDDDECCDSANLAGDLIGDGDRLIAGQWKAL